MDARVAQLRLRVQRYRSYLREGLNAELAGFYLSQIGRDERELEKIMAKPALKPIAPSIVGSVRLNHPDLITAPAHSLR